MSNSYKIKKITIHDKKDVLLFQQKYFYNDEPLNEYLNKERGGELFLKDRGLSTIDVIDEGLSFMAVSETTNEIVGISVNGICEANGDYRYDNHPNPITIFKLVHKLEGECAHLAKLKNESDKVLSVKQLSVKPEWRTKGIGLELLEYTRKCAVEEGFRQIRSVCTSEYSARAFEKVGFHCLHSIKYEDYEEDGKIVFRPDLPHTHIKAMLLRI